MKVSELKSLMNRIKKHISESKMEQHFNNFYNTLQKILQNNQRNVELDTHLIPLFKAISSFKISNLPIGEQQLIKTFKYDLLFGEYAVENIQNILRDQNFDPVGVLKKISNLKTQFIEMNNKSTTLSEFLKPIKTEEDIKIETNEGILKIHFTNEVNVDDFVSFDKWIHNWFMILRHFAVSYGARPEDVKVIYVQKSSPLTIEIATICGIINLIGGATLLVLNNIDKYLDIQKKVKELRKMKYLKTQKTLIQQMEEEAENFKDISAKEIASKILEQIEKKSKTGEDGNSLNLAIKDLFKFYDLGGKIETFIPENATKNQDDDVTQTKIDIIDKFEKIKSLQSDIESLKYIEHNNEK